MWTRSRSPAATEPGKSRSEFTQRSGNRVLPHAFEIACVGFRARSGAAVCGEECVRSPIKSVAETAEARIRTKERIERKIIFFLCDRGEEVDDDVANCDWS
ncbi:hypothetical protein M5689_010567 [Euphorbia peplus]|nr:hypothetical protein M5689_010567 [Euphorbia peplus]